MSRDLQYLANLDRIPQERPRGQQEDELQVFRNTTFYDFDIGRSTDIGTTVDELLMQQEKQIQYPSKQNGPGPSKSAEQNSAPFPFDLSTLQEFSLAGELPAMNTSDLYLGDLGEFPKGGKDAYSWVGSQPSEAKSELESKPEPVTQTVSQNPESLVRQVAEDDKRKRNTAASARFRIKKKLREQEMERSSLMMQQRMNELETRLKQLELENKWLKTLVGERSEARNLSALEDMRVKLLGGEGGNGKET